MTTTTPAPDGWTFPDEWAEEAREVAAEVLTARDDLSGADVGALWQACHLLTSARHAYDVAQRHDFESTTDRGALALHPGLAEERQARTAAAAILARLSRSVSGTNAGTIAGATLARRRWAR